ncbi:MAG: hypothetical protein QM656_02115 [Paracoccaceae bacterium]
MAYVERERPGSPWGMYHNLLAPTAALLAAYHKAGISVTLMGDGTTYRADRALPRHLWPVECEE